MSEPHMSKTPSPTIAGATRPKVDVLSWISSDVDPPRASFFYVIGLAIVALGMIVLPLIYVAMIAGVGWLTYYHAVHDAWILQGTGGSRGRMAAYVAPIICGITVILFMIKPLFARPGRRSLGVVIDANQEPRLVAYVERLCRAMRAPVPREIKVDCDVNASASFRNGLWGLLSNRLTLTIGLPLVNGLTVRQLTGVLAHEFGHFTQWGAMRLSYVIGSVNAWFARVVFERDSWDDQLAEHSEGHGWISLLVLIARACIWITRRILWILMHIGHAISCFMSRQMEYDADRCESLVAGSRAFRETSERMARLSAGHMMAMSQLSETWRARRLADNLPMLIVGHTTNLPPELAKKFDEARKARKTRWFDTHPSNADRIAAVESRPSEGIISGDGPATLLFDRFDVVCKAATLVGYREMIGEHVGSGNLVSTERIVGEDSRAKSEREAFDEYLGHGLSRSRMFFFEELPLEPPADAKAAVDRLRQLQAAMSAAHARAKQAYKAHGEAASALDGLAVASALTRSKMRIDPRVFDLPSTSSGAIEHEQGVRTEKRDEAAAVLGKWEVALRQRMGLTLQLLCVPQIQHKVMDGPELLRDAKRMLAAQTHLRIAFERIGELRHHRSLLIETIRLLSSHGQPDSAGATAMGCVRELADIIRETRLTIENAEYPFEHAEGKATMAQYVTDLSPSAQDPGEVLEVCDQLLDNLETLHFRVVGRLLFIARAVERVLGIPAMAKQPTDPADSASEERPTAAAKEGRK